MYRPNFPSLWPLRRDGKAARCYCAGSRRVTTNPSIVFFVSLAPSRLEFRFLVLTTYRRYIPSNTSNLTMFEVSLLALKCFQKRAANDLPNNYCTEPGPRGHISLVHSKPLVSCWSMQIVRVNACRRLVLQVGLSIPPPARGTVLPHLCYTIHSASRIGPSAWPETRKKQPDHRRWDRQ
ncbi:hypothetical protein BX600DRAFT_317637 [Xylariales sp. PMI_506]|nr:hypothetical protein BX600DRAFT_317637 [Xylariales sp. PMI_506]